MRPFILRIAVLSALLSVPVARADPRQAAQPVVKGVVDAYSLVAFADVRHYAGPGAYDTPQYLRGAVEAIPRRFPRRRS